MPLARKEFSYRWACIPNWSDGNPFQVIPEWRHGRSKVEIGDLLLVGERHDRRLGLVERQALLLQMKVGKPVLHKNRVAGETRQAALYAYWPPINWAAASLRDRLPPPFPRQTSPHPGNATAFGIIPRSEDGSFDCHLVSSGPSLDPPGSLAAKMAYSIRLNLAVDATPGPENGWPRIVQDIMDRAGLQVVP